MSGAAWDSFVSARFQIVPESWTRVLRAVSLLQAAFAAAPITATFER